MMIEGVELLFNALSVFKVFFFLIGALFGLANLFFIKKFLYEILIAKPKSMLKIAFLGLVKFPILYGISILFLSSQKEIPLELLLGFMFTLSLVLYKKSGVFHTSSEGV